VAVSALTTLTAPWLIRGAGPVAAAIDRRLPRALQTYATLYGAWVDDLRNAPPVRTVAARIRRSVMLLVVDVAGIGVIMVGAALGARRAIEAAAQWHAIGVGLATVAIGVAACVLAAPFAIGAIRTSRSLATRLAQRAVPLGEGGLDLGHAPRRALIVGLQFTILLVLGLPLVALTQPLLPSLPVPLLLVPWLIVLAVLIWQSAGNLHGHVRAGVEIITERLAAEARSGRTTAATMTVKENPTKLLPGLGTPHAVQLADGAAAVGKTLKTLHLRGMTGATVLAIHREASLPAEAKVVGGTVPVNTAEPVEILVPTGDEVLRAGDTLILTGSEEATAAAKVLLA
jgi:CPA2 family monovalent cation:H+ antiporter-2